MAKAYSVPLCLIDCVKFTRFHSNYSQHPFFLWKTVDFDLFF